MTTRYAKLDNGVPRYAGKAIPTPRGFIAAEDISEDEPLLAQGIAALKSELGVTDEQVETILSAATTGGSSA